MEKLNIVYISLSGNTKSFVERLSRYCEEEKGLQVSALNVKDYEGDKRMEEPFVSFLPSYLEGGNGVDSGYQEILTTKLGEFIAANFNYTRCFGIVGSGNRNFNHQFCLPARQYAERFGFPVLDEFELRGTQNDITRIADKIINQYEAFVASANAKG